MTDPLTISGAIASLKTAGEIAGAFVGLRDQAMIQTKVIELQSVILAAQSSAMSAQSEQFTLLETKRRLEAKIAELETWEAEKQRYELKQIGRASICYVLKPEVAGSEPPHMICTNCYQHGRKSILLSTGELVKMERESVCPACHARVLGNPERQGERPEPPIKREISGLS